MGVDVRDVRIHDYDCVHGVARYVSGRKYIFKVSAMDQTILAILILVVAVLYIGRRMQRALSPKKPCGCSGCGCSGKKKSTAEINSPSSK